MSKYDKAFVTFIDRPFLWLWALITCFYHDDISYKEAYRQHKDLADWRYKR